MVSDIHGDFKSLEKVLKNESFDRLVVLGDLFSYGKIILDLNIDDLKKMLIEKEFFEFIDDLKEKVESDIHSDFLKYEKPHELSEKF